MIKEEDMVFASVRNDIVNDFVKDMNDYKAGLLDNTLPHYDEKALALFLTLRFRAGCDFRIFITESGLCELMGLSTRTETKQSIMSNLLRMEQDSIITIQRQDNQKFFWITLQYEMFMPSQNYTIIYQSEFDKLSNNNKLLMLLYYIKKYTYQKSNISFVSLNTLERDSGFSRPTICNGIAKLKENILDIYPVCIEFNNGTHKNVSYYKSLCNGSITAQEVQNIASSYYKNIKSITRKDC